MDTFKINTQFYRIEDEGAPLSPQQLLTKLINRCDTAHCVQEF